VCYHHILPLFVSWIFTGIVVTNDGNAILRELDVAHPAAKVLLLTFLYLLFLLKLFYLSIFDLGDPAAKSMIELSRTQDEEVGDGTTSVIVLGTNILFC